MTASKISSNALSYGNVSERPSTERLTWIKPQNPQADVIEHEHLCHLLHVYLGSDSRIEKWEQGALHLQLEGCRHVVLQFLVVEDGMEQLPLELPGLAINVEENSCEELEYGLELFAFPVLGVALAEDVVGVERIAGGDEIHVGEPRAFEHERAAGFLEGSVGCAMDIIGPRVPKEAWKHTQHRPFD
ncbi:unnamed protein product [Linum tenue]|uniref:Uncharacterized protein n=1 Tax=Linum tenue TaxID=586396 RepID=A0AAV0N8S4_9ROSI|nr:unnamed protein product [Linum tenue]